MAEDKMSAEAFDDLRFHWGCTQEADDRHKVIFFNDWVPELFAHIATLTSRAEKAEGEAKYEAARAAKAEAVLADYKEEARDFEHFRSGMARDYCALVEAIGVDMDAPPAVLDAVRRLGISAQAIADLKREADRMRGALEPFAELDKNASSDGSLHFERSAKDDDSRLAYIRVGDVRRARAALSHQADDAGAVTGSEERLREALRPFERFAEYLAGRPGVTLAGATVREETIMPDDEIATVGDASGFATIRARHFLDAAAALSEQQGGK
ncbi:MAG TPA: hypothetical protein PKY87_02255 [Terricaulis sp.]|nr:hypothetical protein [Terricaulis sp.]